MEDDDEFGDLYTDVLLPFAASAPPPQQASAAPAETSQPLRRPIDLNNLHAGDEDDDDEDDGIVFGAPASSIPGVTVAQTLASDSAAAELGGGAAEGSNLRDDEVTFDIEEANSVAEEVIPGLGGGSEDAEASRRDDGVDGGGGGEDWDSDSEDDLQIVLNGPMTMERGGGIGDDDDEDEDELVIVADGDPSGAMEPQEWGEDGAQAADGERKEIGEAGKAGPGGMAAAAKVSYVSHGYHPFHSQFKYVRPGAAPIPGAASSTGPGGVPGQVRPLVNMGPVGGRGRGDWRPMGLKNATSMRPGFTGWGGNAAGRGFGGGLEFTLPSHKTIFDVDIDSFEEKPWKYPTADSSDFFNFGLNEDSWKDYCKQLEQLRLESTMQSKIRVYESGRAEQEYDPDLPPELAAATGIHEVPSEHAIPLKSEGGQGDLPKGPARVRPPLPPGRAIQVEGGYGERLPSIDTRPPRVRDSDAIIEIVLQDSLDDDGPAGNDVHNSPDNGSPKEDLEGSIVEADIAPVDSEYLDKFSLTDRKRDSGCDEVSGGDGALPSPPELPVRNSESCAVVSVNPSDSLSEGYEERQTNGRSRERSPRVTPKRNARNRKYLDNEPEDSDESMNNKHSPLSSPASVRDAHESSVERRDVDDQDDAVLVDGRSQREKGDSPSDVIAETGDLEDGETKKLKPKYLMEQAFDQEPDDREDSRAARSSDNSRARSGSSRDFAKRRDGIDEEVVQRHPNRMVGVKRHYDEKEQAIQRRTRDGRQELERNRMVVKGREEPYTYREFDPSPVRLPMRTDGFERWKERDTPDGAWQRRGDDSYSRRIRTEETRKRERGDEIGSRHRSKVREIDRSDKEELMHSRKQMDNGSHRVNYEKDVGPRHRERDDNVKVRYEHMDEYHGKRKKDEEHLRREYVDKEEIIHGHRDNTSHRKRDRDELLDQRKRDGQQRIRENLDDHHSVRHKDESWLQRERSERGRDREEWRIKQSQEENIPKRERDEGRGVTRGGRSSEDKGWVGHLKVKDESKSFEKDYQYKDTVRHGEPSKRRDRAEDEGSHHGGREDAYARGNPMSNGERRPRQERPSMRNDRSANASDDQKAQDRKHRENTRRNKESEGGDNVMLVSSKRNQEDNGGQSIETALKGSVEQGFGEQHLPSKRKKGDALSDDEQQQDSRRGRSKLERWTSHKERDFAFKTKSSSTPKFKEIDRNNSGFTEGSKISDEPSKPFERVDSHQSLAEERDSTDLEGKEADTRPLDDQHLDTVEKLKKRSERFKLPMPSDKEALIIKKTESESMTSTKSGSQVDSEVKQERPARKRRWISS